MNILLLYVWDRNRGDEALTRAFSNLLMKLNPNCQIDILPIYPRELEFSVPGATNLRMRYGRNYMSKTIYYIYRIYKKLQGKTWLRPYIRGYNMISRFLIKLSEKMGYLNLKFLKKYDLICFAPQGQTLSYGHDMFDSALFALSAVKKLNIPYILAGISVGPFCGMKDHKMQQLKDIFEEAKLIILREKISLEYIKYILPDVSNIKTSIDVVFLLANETRTEVLETQRSSYSGKGYIGSCISLSLTEKDGNLSYFDFLENYVKKMAEFYDYVIKTSGTPLLLLPHIDRDYPVLLNIKKLMTNAAKVKVVDSGYDDREHRRLIRETDFFVSTRYHPTIFAILGEVPFMSIIQHFKVTGALETLGLDDIYCRQDDDLEVYKSTFDKTWSQRKQIEKKVIDAKKRAIELSKTYSDSLRQILL